MGKNSKYLVRPSDNSIFELDESNGCYRGHGGPTDSDGNRPPAYSHFTYENLTENYSYFPIKETEIAKYEELNKKYYRELSDHIKFDHHG